MVPFPVQGDACGRCEEGGDPGNPLPKGKRYDCGRKSGGTGEHVVTLRLDRYIPDSRYHSLCAY